MGEGQRWKREMGEGAWEREKDGRGRWEREEGREIEEGRWEREEDGTGRRVEEGRNGRGRRMEERGGWRIGNGGEREERCDDGGSCINLIIWFVSCIWLYRLILMYQYSKCVRVHWLSERVGLWILVPYCIKHRSQSKLQLLCCEHCREKEGQREGEREGERRGRRGRRTKEGNKG